MNYLITKLLNYSRRRLALILLAVTIGLTVAAAVLGWSNPTQAPPGGNPPAPINVGSDTQTKSGSLNIMGNVGIGTTGPGAKLHVMGGIMLGTQPGYNNSFSTDANYNLIISGVMAQNDYFKIQGTGTTDNGALEIVTGDNGNEPIIFKQISGATQYERMRIDSTGNVGIGTTGPAVKLDVDGTVYVRDVLEVRRPSDGTNAGMFNLSNATNGKVWRIPVRASEGDNLNFYNWDGATWRQNMALQMGGQNAYFFGNVGIGTTTPGQKLTIAGTGAVFGVDNMATFQAKNSAGTYENYLWPRWTDNIMYLNYGSGGFNIRNNSSVSTMFMTSSGNVGIGTTAPGYKLEVAGDIRSTGYMFSSTKDKKTYTLSNGAGWYRIASQGGVGRGGRIRIWGISGSNVMTDITFYVSGMGYSQGSSINILDNVYYNGNHISNIRAGTDASNNFVIDVELAGIDNPTTMNVEADGNIILASSPTFNPTAPTGGVVTVSGKILGGGSSRWPYSFTTGNVGIGTTTPAVPLHVVGNARFSVLTASRLVTTDSSNNLASTISSANVASSITDETGSGSLVFATSPAFTTSVIASSTTFSAFNTVATTLNVGGAATVLNLGASTGTTTINNPVVIVGGGSGKINVGTVDPIYKIGGRSYATYAAFMTGQKEETTGTLNLSTSDVDKGAYRAVIDFNKAEKGSDLWLFWQITDFGTNWENLVALLTPSFNGRVWYAKDPSAKKLFIYGSQSGEVSYRLTAPRFDHAKWPNTSTDDADGFTLPEK